MARVLLVDDDDIVRAVTNGALRSRGHSVEEAANGAIALERLASDPLPDVIVLDLDMPIMDGFAFRDAQIRDARLVKIPVVVATGGAPQGRTGCLGCTVLLHKPVSGQVLDAAIGKAISSMAGCLSAPEVGVACLPASVTGDSPQGGNGQQ